MLIVATTTLAVGVFVPAEASHPSGATLTPSSRVVRWTGGPLTGSAGGFITSLPCTKQTCDEFSLTVNVPPSYWRSHPGGVVVRADWDNPDNEMDLLVYDATGQEIGRSDQFHTNFEQAFLPSLSTGTYTVRIVSTDVVNAVYRGTASIVRYSTPPVATAPNTMRFAAPTLVDPQFLSSEPGLWVDGNRVFVTSPSENFSWVWRSDDAGRTFRLLDAHVTDTVADPRHRPCIEQDGGQDSDVITDRTGRLYMADLDNFGVSVAFSKDHGATWTCRPTSATYHVDDRPWLAPAAHADGDGPNIDAYLAYRDFIIGTVRGGAEVQPIVEHFDVTRDGGTTWTHQNAIAPGLINFSGNIFTDADGTLYDVFDGRNAMWIARSTDEGKTFSIIKIADRLGAPNNRWASGAADSAGTVYATWVDRGPNDVVYSYSNDHGTHWSVPRRVNVPGTGLALMPWIAASKTGDVAIAWYESQGFVRQPNEAPATMPWNAWAARSLNANTTAATFQVTRMSETPIHYGPICKTTAGDCIDRVGDFFKVAIGADGGLISTYVDNGRTWTQQPDDTSGVPGTYIVVSRQVAGIGMSSAGLTRAALRPVVGAADTFPAIPQTRFTSLPSATRTTKSLQLTFSLASSRDLTAALSAANTGVATDAYWIAIWKTKDSVQYAGLHVTRTGAPTFFGGDQPVGVVRPDATDERYESYPPKFAIPGHIDESSGRVSFTLPASAYHLAPTDTLHGLQLFSFTGFSTVRTGYQPLQLVDVTPSQDVAAASVTRSTPSGVVLGTRQSGDLPATGVDDRTQSGTAFVLLACALALAVRLTATARRATPAATSPHRRGEAGRRTY